MPVPQSVYDTINSAVNAEFLGRPINRNTIATVEAFVNGMLKAFHNAGVLEVIPRVSYRVDGVALVIEEVDASQAS